MDEGEERKGEGLREGAGWHGLHPPRTSWGTLVLFVAGLGGTGVVLLSAAKYADQEWWVTRDRVVPVTQLGWPLHWSREGLHDDHDTWGCPYRDEDSGPLSNACSIGHPWLLEAN